MSAHKNTSTATEQMVNGVDVQKVMDTVAAIEKEPGLAKFKFRLHNTWKDGGHSQGEVRDFHGANQENVHVTTHRMDADEPELLAGHDRGANPIEHLLNALATCVTASLAYHSAIRGIRIDEIESDLEADIDVRGFLGLTDEVRRGCQNVRVAFKVKTDAENIDKLKAFSKLSPVFETMLNGTNVDVQIQRK